MGPNFLGFNGEELRFSSAAVAWNNDALIPALKLLAPPLVRLFGGTTANYWNWSSGTFSKTAAASPNITAGGPAPPVALSRFAKVFNDAGVMPVYDLNIMTDSLTDQIAMLNMAKSLGMPVVFLELGNELYIGNPDEKVAFPTAQAYGSVASQWIVALKATFPGVRIAAVGYSDTDGTRSSRLSTWNTEMLTTLTGEDAITFHPYWNSGLSSGANINDPKNIATVLAQPELTFSAVSAKDLSILPAGVEAWLTEWNFRIETGVDLNSRWMQGLSLVDFAVHCLADPRVGLSMAHALIGNSLYAALNTNSSFQVTASGVALHQVFVAVSGMTAAQPLSFVSANPQNSANGLVGIRLKGNGTSRLLIENTSPNDMEVNVPSELGTRFTLVTTTAAPDALIQGYGSAKTETSSAQGKFVVPAYGIALATAL